MQNIRKHTFIQNKREINSRKYKIQEKLDLGYVKNRLEEVNMTLNGSEIHLPMSVILPFRDKFRSRKLLRKQLLLLHMMLKTG